MTDVFLYPGESNPNDVRLRDPTTILAVNASLAWTEYDDTMSINSNVTNSGTIGWVEDDDVVSINSNVSQNAQLSWTEDDDIFAITGEVFIKQFGGHFVPSKKKEKKKPETVLETLNKIIYPPEEIKIEIQVNEFIAIQLEEEYKRQRLEDDSLMLMEIF